MTIFIITLSLIFAVASLYKLWVIDMKTRILPNIYVFRFMMCGLLVNIASKFIYTYPHDMLLGALAGMILMLAVRFAANHLYKQDTLGLGDVKLIGAAGVWLGLEYIFLAISVGAFAGLTHGFIHGMLLQKKTGKKTDFSKLTIPAGPGFIVGIVIIACVKFKGLPQFVLDNVTF
ncbi:MAG: prepilin peptidase [Alphaproteobacteria bacterium]|nr:prepilin peptidase [Alphaproteobacteria bacterium]